MQKKGEANSEELGKRIAQHLRNQLAKKNPSVSWRDYSSMVYFSTSINVFPLARKREAVLTNLSRELADKNSRGDSSEEINPIPQTTFPGNRNDILIFWKSERCPVKSLTTKSKTRFEPVVIWIAITYEQIVND